MVVQVRAVAFPRAPELGVILQGDSEPNPVGVRQGQRGRERNRPGVYRSRRRGNVGHNRQLRTGVVEQIGVRGEEAESVDVDAPRVFCVSNAGGKACHDGRVVGGVVFVGGCTGAPGNHPESLAPRALSRQDNPRGFGQYSLDRIRVQPALVQVEGVQGAMVRRSKGALMLGCGNARAAHNGGPGRRGYGEYRALQPLLGVRKVGVVGPAFHHRPEPPGLFPEGRVIPDELCHLVQGQCLTHEHRLPLHAGDDGQGYRDVSKGGAGWFDGGVGAGERLDGGVGRAVGRWGGGGRCRGRGAGIFSRPGVCCRARRFRGRFGAVPGGGVGENSPQVFGFPGFR